MKGLMMQVPALSIVGPFADRLLASDFPDLAPQRRTEVVSFIAARVEIMPSFTRFGVLALGTLFRAIMALPGGWPLATIVMRLPLPFIGEYPRLSRSLAVAYIWEHWPHTTPTGAEAAA
jgi:hypothetical protein